MTKRRILHMLFPGTNVSPFDVNMAVDAGYDVVVPYSQVTAEDAGGLVQDAIFSRPPKQARNTGVFIGGYDVNLAADMLVSAKRALVPPFEVSTLVDPNGAYTTSAALVAMVEKKLVERQGKGLAGRNLKVFGGGPVGLCAAVLAAKCGATATLVRLTASAKSAPVEEFAARYDVTLQSQNGQTDALKASALADAEIAITTAKAGICVLEAKHLASATALDVVADVNAVPPAGIEGLSPTDANATIKTGGGECCGIGALAIGKVKYDVQHGLLLRMLSSEDALALDFPDAFDLAQKHV